MNNIFYSRLLSTGAFFGAIGVILGAFGAHFLKSRLEVTDLETIRTAVLYLFIHVLITLIIVLLARNAPDSRILRSAGILFVIGIVFFSGSLFILATEELTHIHGSFVAIFTPLGGLSFILGWVMLFIYGFSRR